MTNETSFKGVLGVDEIVKLIPYRYPMLMIDRVVEMEKDLYAKSYKNVSFGESYFQGHFPGHSIMPGVMIIEAIAQTSVVLWCYFNQDKIKSKVVYFSSLEKAKFRKPVIPGDVLELQVHFKRRIKNIWKFRGEAYVEGKLVAENIFSAALVDLKENKE